MVSVPRALEMILLHRKPLICQIRISLEVVEGCVALDI